MSTIAVDLYVLWQEDRFVTSLTNPAVPSLPAIVAGDTWNISAYFVDNTSPMQLHRFAGATVAARIRAAGNSNHLYADATASAEIAPATGAVVTTLANGGGSTIARKHVEFGSPTSSGQFRITFTAPNSCRGNDPANQGVYTVHGTTAYIPYNATAGQIAAAINALPWQKYDEHGDKVGGLVATLPLANAAFVVTNVDDTGFDIEYGTSTYVGNGGTAVNPQPYQTVPPGIAQPVVDTSNLIFKFGWSISLPFTAGDFTDYLISANGPAYFEVMLNGAQAAVKQLTGAPGGGNAPAFTNGPPQNSGSIGTPYDFTYTASGFPAPTFSLTSGTLPTGLSLSSAGRLTGTPSAIGTYSGVVTATNSNGTVTQAFSITIGGSGGTPGPGGVGRLPSYRDGNFNVLDQSDGAYFDDRDDEWPGLIIWHVPYVIDFDYYLATKPAVGSYEAPFGYFWKDTPLRWIGDGIVEFERLRHNLPADANRPISVSKAYQAYLPTYTNGQLTDIAINSFSRSIEANCNYHYALDDPGALPVIPVIQIIPYLHGQLATDLGTGFPTRSFNGQTIYDNNYGVSPIDGGGIDHILGRLYCRRIITG